MEFPGLNGEQHASDTEYFDLAKDPFEKQNRINDAEYGEAINDFKRRFEELKALAK